MNFYVNDLTEEAKERLVVAWGCTFVEKVPEDEPIGIMYNEREQEKLSKISGEWEHISKLIPILRNMGYNDLRLRYEDCDIWTLTIHTTQYDELTFKLC